MMRRVTLIGPNSEPKEMPTMDEEREGDAVRQNELPAFLQPLLERMHATASAETVFGPSRQERGRTIVPVARVAYGLGGGAGSATNKKRKHDGESQPDEGAGGGGGITVTPVGVLEVTDSGSRFVPFTAAKVITASVFLGGLILGMIVGRPGR
jgi:uncharacterized spore protein YtfJ